MTTMQSSSEALIKTDETGRMRTSAARRESLLAEFECSGLSGPKFAALAGVKYQTFATWVRKRRVAQASDGVAVSAKPVVGRQWWEAVVEPVSPGSGLVLHLPGGVRAEVTDERQTALAVVLIRSLARPC